MELIVLFLGLAMAGYGLYLVWCRARAVIRRSINSMPDGLGTLGGKDF